MSGLLTRCLNCEQSWIIQYRPFQGCLPADIAMPAQECLCIYYTHAVSIRRRDISSADKPSALFYCCSVIYCLVGNSLCSNYWLYAID